MNEKKYFFDEKIANFLCIADVWAVKRDRRLGVNLDKNYFIKAKSFHTCKEKLDCKIVQVHLCFRLRLCKCKISLT